MHAFKFEIVRQKLVYLNENEDDYSAAQCQFVFGWHGDVSFCVCVCVWTIIDQK